MRRGALARAVVAVALLAGTVVLLPRPAGAQVTGGCSATIDGQDVNAAQNVRSAIVVDESSTVVVRGVAPGPIDSYKVYLTFAGIRIPAAEGTTSATDNSYTTTVDVATFARYGVGVYRVEGETTGTVCTGWAYVKVTGRFPLTTVAGIVGSLLVLLGLFGLVFSRPRVPVAPGGSGLPPGTAGPGPPGAPGTPFATTQGMNR
jgi:hypothetical protein